MKLTYKKKDTVRVGLVGLGYWGKNLLRNLYDMKVISVACDSNLDIIEERKKGYELVCLKDKKTLLTGERFKILYKDIVSTKSRTDHLEGRVAMTGKARGRVRVILHNKRNISKEVANFKKGEILVTEMTRPDTIMACKKASAVITDEGGITSHAAIISRELKIPCVIATKIATQLLKTGDLVEVDADRGFIKILKTK